MHFPLAPGASESRLWGDEKDRGKPAVQQGSRAVKRGDHNRPELLKDALKRQIGRLGIARKLACGRVLAGFSGLVGPQVAARAKPESLVQGVLTLVVPDAAWRQELTMQKVHLIERLNAAAGEKVIRDIFFVAVSRRKD